MGVIMKITHFYVQNMLLLSVVGFAIDIPLCGSIDGSKSSRDTDQIIFKGQQMIRTIEVNGTIHACYPDGSPVEPTSSSADSGDRLSGTALAGRIGEGNQSAILITFYFTLSLPRTNHTKAVFELFNASDGKNHTVREAPSGFVVNIGECANRNQSYCTSYANYPVRYIEDLMKKQAHKYQDALSSDAMFNDVSTRIDGFDEYPLCVSDEALIYPQAGKSLEGTDQLIINTPDYKQGVRISKCAKPDQKCSMSENFPNGYRSLCKQQYVVRELLSLSSEKQPIKSKFKFEACCSCTLYRP